MATRTATVASRVGLHARPASLFTQAVAATGLPIKICKPGGTPVDASSILMVMAQGIGHGVEVTLEAPDGPEGDAALESLVQMLETDMDAPEEK